MILVDYNLCFSDELTVKDFKKNRENIINFSKQKVYSIQVDNIQNEDDGLKLIRETGDLIADVLRSEVIITSGEYIVFEKNEFLNFNSIKGIKFTKDNGRLSVPFLVDKVIFIKNIDGSISCSFIKKQTEDDLTLESNNLKGDWFESKIQYENFRRLLADNKLDTLEEQKKNKEKKGEEQKNEDSKLIYGITTINNYLSKMPSGIKFSNGEKSVQLPLVEENGDNPNYYKKVLPQTDMLYSFYKLANIRILVSDNASSIILDDFLLKKILIEDIKSTDLPWRVNYHQIALSNIVGQLILCKLEDKSIVLMKILECSENSLKFNWVHRKDGIIDFSQMKSNSNWAEIFESVKGRTSSKVSQEDFIKIFSFYKTNEDKEKAVKSAILDGFNINEIDIGGETPLTRLAMTVIKSDDIEILLKNGADPNVKNKFGGVALLSCNSN